VKFLNKELEPKSTMEDRNAPRTAGLFSVSAGDLFPSGEDAIDPRLTHRRENRADHPNCDSVRLEGHTDSIPIHTVRFHSNWELSAARSMA